MSTTNCAIRGKHRYDGERVGSDPRVCADCGLPEPLPETFESELAGAEAAARAARARMGTAATEPAAPPRLADALHLTVPPPEAQHAAEEFWLRRSREEAAVAEETRRRQAMARQRNVLERIPAHYHWAWLEAPELTQRVRHREAIARAVRAVARPRLVFVGAGGSGKTSLAVALFRAHYIEHGGGHVFEAAWRLSVARSRQPLGQGEPECVARAIAADLLVVDDLGGEKPNHTTAIDDVIFERHWHARPTWVTTGRSPEEIADRYGDNIARRVFEDAVVIDCEGTGTWSKGKGA